jgi:TIR domain
MAKQAGGGRDYLVFISHSSKDRWIVRQMAALIEQKGRRHHVKVFLDDTDIKAGDSIPEEIRQGLRDCDELMVLISRESIDRPWVQMEMEAVWVLGKRIVAIVDKVTPEEMPKILIPYKALDINDFDEYVKQLIARAAGAKK